MCLVAACGGCSRLLGLETPNLAPDGEGSSGSGTVRITGTVTGVAGRGLILQDNGGDDLAIAGDGAFTFPTPLPRSSAYAVSVSTQPSQPTQFCAVTNPSGTATADVTDIVVHCMTQLFTVGGNAAGVSNTGLVLENDGGDDLTIFGLPDVFTFPTSVPSGSPFAVTIKTNNTGLGCIVLGGTGTVGGADVRTVQINCVANKYVVSGTISGLEGTVVLSDMLGNPGVTDSLSVSSSGGFAFGNYLQAGESYSVAIATQPSFPPASQTCVVANGAGVANANVTSVQVQCTTNAFTVGAMVSGLHGTLLLENDGADDTTVSTDGAVTFATPIASGSTYAVTIKAQPAGQTCTVSNGRGTVKGANIGDVAIACQ